VTIGIVLEIFSMATLLVVDDDNHIRETLSELFNSDHEVHTADRAEQALTFLEFENYDAILTDLAMPGLSGRDLLDHIQQTTPNIPVIVMSGTFGAGDGPEVLALGAFAYFSKPFEPREIEAAVNQALEAKLKSAGQLVRTQGMASEFEFHR
jgi:DNA-binding NtrC family response regulator